MVNKLLNELVIQDYPIVGDKYIFNNNPVPRVTEILSAMLHEDYLMGWSNSIGLYKHQKYTDVLDNASSIGTYTHKFIEDFINSGAYPVADNIPVDMHAKINNAFYSFLQWWNIITKNEYEILMQEKELICKFFGGTLDLLIKINGKIYIVDFKTSNHPSYKHQLQLSAYRYMLRECENIEVDGVIALMLDKNTYSFKEMILNFDISEHLEFINRCEETFLSLVYSFYQRKMTEFMYNDIFKRR